jgi:transcriptional regulator with XRE-family HTH domain
MSENFLRKIREEKSFGQSELARKAGVSKQLISGFEKGRNGLSAEVLRKIADVLKVNPTYIITGKKSGESFNDAEKNRMMEALKITHEFYKDYDFDHETMSRIATEMFGFMSDFEKLKAEIGGKNFSKSLNEKIAAGLAAKCFLSFKGKHK